MEEKNDIEKINSANEKHQGRALFERQQRLAQLVKAAAQLGLNARRAQKLDSEVLTMQTLSEIPSLENSSSLKEVFIF